ncbi:MAG: ABC transporter permease, partial [Actinomycetia bacterium]|nr:ABC transporter permease [Actinomycetes bacterium]
LPALFSAGRICVSLALVGAVIGELYGGSTQGLGYQARIAQARSLVDQLWGSVLSLALIGIVLTLLVMALERRVLRWHTSQTTI